MQVRKLFYAFLALFLIGISITVAGDGVQRKYLSSDKEFYLNEAEVAWLRPGVNLKIQSVAVSGSDVSVTFRIADDQDQGLDRLGIEQPGTVSTSFILARIKPGDSQYTSYTTRTQTSPITGKSAIQATTDSGGSYASLGNGVYKYTFASKLPTGFEVDATHTVGMTAVRDVRALAEQLGLFQLATTGRYVANATLDFVPSGKAVTQVRDVVRTAVCNQCHDPLALHGGSRREVGYCILCHQPQTTDPDTGNTVDMKVMIHKIHQGASLPSVLAGTPYQIIGFNQTVFNFGEIHFPLLENVGGTGNCTFCHQQGTQSDNWKTKPSRVACGSCHDDVKFETGEHHAGGVQLDDTKCTICHQADTGVEFDNSVAGAHTVPESSKQLKGINVVITGITNTSQGSKPTVTFTVKDNAGNPIDISPSAGRLDSLVLRLAGPATDYTWNVSENVVTTTVSSATTTSSGYSYTFKTNAIPAGAKGTYAVGAEFYNDGVVLAGPLLGQNITAEETGFNPILYFSVDGSAVQKRREVVNVNTRCNVCHKSLRLHHGNRLDTSYCIMCHNPATVDNPNGARTNKHPVPEGTVPTSINLKFMIHRIHSGAELENDYTVYRSRGVFNFNGIHYPGDRRNCAKCHVGTSYTLPLQAGVANTLAPREFYSPLGPAAAACLGCHDGQNAAAHAFLMTAPTIGESCATCHKEGAEFSVSRVHAR